MKMKGAITEWLHLLPIDRLSIVIQDIENFKTKYDISPEPKHIFDCFRNIFPKDVKIVIIWPYQKPLPNVQSGVLILTSSFTVGLNCPDYLKDHSIVWQEVLQNIISIISQHCKPKFILVGEKNLKFEKYIISCETHIVEHESKLWTTLAKLLNSC